MSRREDLEQHIRESYQIIRKNEDALRISDDAKEKSRDQHVMDEQWELIRGYLDEYELLCKRQSQAIPEEIAEISARFSGYKESRRSIRPIPFKNREDEIELVLSSFGEPYYLIGAPAGYGKSVLLSQLKERFESQHPKWVCALASANFSQLSAVAAELAKELGINLTSSNEDAKRLGRSLANQLKIERSEDIRGCGVVILIDLDGHSSLDLAKQIIDHFVPGIWEGLETIDFKSPRKQKPFRVILAGRHLTRELPTETPGWKRKRLSPFDYRAVYETARDYLVGHTENEPNIRVIAAHILYLTGGHPGAMAHLLRSYREEGLTPDEFLAQFQERVERDRDNTVKTAIDRAYESISADLREILDKTCVLRYFTTDMLKAVLGHGHPVFEKQDEHDLADKLTKTQHLHRDGYFLEDDITRRLLAIRLRRADTAEFTQRCRAARELCEEQLRTSNAQQPAKWAIESLFQFLQQHAEDVLVPNEQDRIRNQFFEHELPHVLKTLVAVKGRNVKEEQRVLRQKLEEDWEFQFTINYYLYSGVYENEPYQKLLQEVERHFGPEGRDRR